jgi:hypothetical protein
LLQLNHFGQDDEIELAQRCRPGAVIILDHRDAIEQLDAGKRSLTLSEHIGVIDNRQPRCRVAIDHGRAPHARPTAELQDIEPAGSRAKAERLGSLYGSRSMRPLSRTNATSVVVQADNRFGRVGLIEVCRQILP